MIHLRVKYTGAVPGVARKKLTPWKKAAYLAAGIDWHRHALPQHFTKAGARKYGYAPRAGESGNTRRGGFRKSYTGRKLARMGHTRPLVYSGTSETLCRMRDVRVTSKSARVILRAPGLNRRNPHSRVDMRAEVTEQTQADIDRAARAFDRELQTQIDRDTTTTTKDH